MVDMGSLFPGSTPTASKDTANAIMNGNRGACGIARADRVLRGLLLGRERKQETMKNGADSAGLFEYGTCKELIMRLRQDADLIQSITELARVRGIEAASFTAIGALKRAKLGYYHQKNHKYREMGIEFPHELVSCVGNVSQSEGKPFVHAHVVLADDKGNTKAGHLLEGIVFAAEVHLRQLEGPKLERKLDEVTGLWLWSTE
jgi:predicted DNA-binding protein with PD1-like motif